MIDPAMVDVEVLLDRAQAAGVHLMVEGSRLRFRAPPDALSNDLRDAIRQHRAAIIEWLRSKAEHDIREAPLSGTQRGLWLLSQLAPDSSAYNVIFATRVHGDIERGNFLEALQIVCDRHDTLRTSFDVRNGSAVRVIAGHVRLALEEVDTAGWSETMLRQRVLSDYSRPFDLRAGPVIRCTIYTQSPGVHLVALVVHHIAVDGTGLIVLVEELFDVYTALSRGEPLPARKEASDYSDFVSRQQTELARSDAGLKYWAEVLTPQPEPLDLPLDRPRPRIPQLKGGTIWSRISPELAARLRELARLAGVTDYMLLLSLYYAFLHRMTGQSDITVGTPVRGRPRAQFARMIGHFVNLIPVRIRDLSRTSFSDLMQQVRATFLEGLTHQAVPLADMVESASGHKGGVTGPPFQTMFVMQELARHTGFEAILSASDPREVQAGRLRLSQYALEQQEGQFDLSLDVWPAGEGMLCSWRYDSALFDSDTIARWAESFLTLAASAVDHPDDSIQNLELLSAADRMRLESWNRTDRDYNLDTTLHAAVESQARRTPHATAVEAGPADARQVLTYQELDRRSNALAYRLQQMGVTRDTPVVVSMERSAELVVSLLAVLKSGGAYLPVDPGYPADRQTFMIEDSRAPVILTRHALKEGVTCPARTAVVAVASIWNELDVDARPVAHADADSLAYIIYTSGSTGKPKGAMIEHRSIVNRLLWMQEHFKLLPSESVLQKTSFSFDVSVWEFFWPLVTGARLVMARPDGHRDPDYLIELIQRESITTIHFVPSMLSIFLDALRGRSLSSLRRVICSGEALNPELRDRVLKELPHAELTNLYGPTEAAVDVSWWRCRQGDDRTVVPIGWPVANTRLYILDEQLREVPIGVPGELYIGGEQVGRGYLNRPDLTAERFVDDRFDSGRRLYRTGDRARFLNDGAIEFLGRLDNQVKVRGFRVELGEVEARILAHEAVSDVTVIVRNDALVAFFVSSEPGITAAGLRKWVGTALPDHMVPNTFVRLDRLPLTPNGKVDRRALLTQPSATLDGESGSGAALENDTQRKLAAIWSGITGMPDPRLQDSFFDSGGHSLLAVRLASAIRDTFHVEIPIRVIFDAPRLEHLAAAVEQAIAEHRESGTHVDSVESFEF